MRLNGVSLFTIAISIAGFLVRGAAQTNPSFHPSIPRTWDEDALKTMDLPVVGVQSHTRLTPEEYYRLPVLPIPKSYPVYDPDHEPPGYLESIRREGQKFIDVDSAAFASEDEWVRWGESLVGAAIPVGGNPTILADVHDRDWYARTGPPVSRDGVLPVYRYVVGRDGQVTIRPASCVGCHVRILPDGQIVVGAQGNYPGDRARGFRLMRDAQGGGTFTANQLTNAFQSTSVPWQRPDPADPVRRMTATELADAEMAVPPGIVTRFGTSHLFPPKLPDLIGVKDRKYLDATGLVQHRSIGDLMRYMALAEGMEEGDRYDAFGPFGRIPPARYSDEQLYAMALYIYSLKPPENPNRPAEASRRGEGIFRREGCTTCHTPPLYTNNKLTPAAGFSIPPDHLTRFEILRTSVHTDPRLALNTRKGTGYYRVPSLKGVWYRGPFEHNGSVATLEDWFDPARLRDDYVPTGFKGVGVTTRAVRGHEFGLRLTVAEKAALIAFLRTL